MSPPSRSMRAALLAAGCACSVALGQAGADLAAPAAPVQQAGLSVTTAVAQTRQWPLTLEASGAVFPWHEAVISARSAGLALTQVLADRGSRVQRGQVLARFDDRALRAELAQAEASVAQAQASAQQAVINRDRTLALRETGAVSAQDDLQAQTTAATAVAQWNLAKAALEAAQVRLENAVVTAPDSGTLSSRSATLGQVASTGTELFRLIRQDRLEWRAEVPAQHLAGLKAGQAAAITLPDGQTLKGSLRTVSPALEGSSRLALAQVDLAPGSAARAGMYLQGRLTLGQAPAVAVPAESIVLRDGRPHVFVLEGQKARRLAIATGRREGTWVEVTQGLPAGRPVVVRGAGLLADGEVIQVRNGATGPAAPQERP